MSKHEEPDSSVNEEGTDLLLGGEMHVLSKQVTEPVLAIAFEKTRASLAGLCVLRIRSTEVGGEGGD